MVPTRTCPLTEMKQLRAPERYTVISLFRHTNRVYECSLPYMTLKVSKIHRCNDIWKTATLLLVHLLQMTYLKIGEVFEMLVSDNIRGTIRKLVIQFG